MADIKRFPVLRHIRSDNGFHLLHFKDGKLRRSGRGLSFWFLPMSASMAEVPVVDQSVTFGFSLKTSDFQDVSIQGALTWRVSDVARVAERIDFTIDLARGVYLNQPLEAVATQFVQLAQQHADVYASTTPLKELLQRGPDRLRSLLTEGLTHAEELAESGITVVAVRVTAIRPKPDLEKAMEAPIREHIQQEADEAAFARRALAVEKERAIKENELKNQIELAKRDEELIAQKGQNERRQATEKGEALRISAEAKAKQTRIETGAQAESVQTLSKVESEKIQLVEGANVGIERERFAAQLEWERGRVDALEGVSPHVLYGIAAQQLASKLEKIEHLSLTPEFLSPLLGRLIDAGTKRLETQTQP
jgi:regulator of protease activity HflC (stomatin/prohibitin superfamily)